jgi:hypothetical protein
MKEGRKFSRLLQAPFTRENKPATFFIDNLQQKYLI